MMNVVIVSRFDLPAGTTLFLASTTGTMGASLI